jgi:hypothetical protein
MPIQSAHLKIKSYNSIVKKSLKLFYTNNLQQILEASLEIATNIDLVISKLMIKVGDEEIIGVVKDK